MKKLEIEDKCCPFDRKEGTNIPDVYVVDAFSPFINVGKPNNEKGETSGEEIPDLKALYILSSN
nr:MAG TPA: hypothetical protein [Bacteriophage sp.]